MDDVARWSCVFGDPPVVDVAVQRDVLGKENSTEGEGGCGCLGGTKTKCPAPEERR